MEQQLLHDGESPLEVGLDVAGEGVPDGAHAGPDVGGVHLLVLTGSGWEVDGQEDVLFGRDLGQGPNVDVREVS